MRKRTDALRSELETAENFDQFAKLNEKQFLSVSQSEVLKKAILRSGLKKADLARRSGLSEVYLHQILSGRRSPSRNRMLALCLALGMGPDETNESLKECAYAPLYVRIRRDALLLYALKEGWSVYDVNEKLFDLGEETLL